MKKVLLFLISIYKSQVSIWFESKNIHCKYTPTCSEYAYQAIEKYGVVKGSLKSIYRIMRCNPFSKGGYDPLK